MANLPEQVPLPDSVEQLLNRICREQNQPPIDSSIRCLLAAVGEESAFSVLTTISSCTIKYSLDGFIKRMIEVQSPSAVANTTSPRREIPFPPSTASPGSSARRMTNHQGPGTGTRSPVLGHAGSNSPLMGPREEEEMPLNPTLEALGELEFRKAFLLLNYVGEESIEHAIGPETIRSLRNLPMKRYEEEIWNRVGRIFTKESKERIPSLVWESKKPCIYHCHVHPSGSLRFKGPYLHEQRTHLQKSLGDDNVLLVKFAEKPGTQKTSIEDAHALYRRIGQSGIRVGLRLYRFFVFKDGGREAKKKDPTTSTVKCYFVRVKSYASVDEREPYILMNKSIDDARSLFMHAHTTSSLDKFMARFSLILSKTLTLGVDMASVDVQTIEDVYCLDENGKIVINHDGKACIHTDGCGFISEDLAKLCPNDVYKGGPTKGKIINGISDLDEYGDKTVANGNVESSTSEPPLLMQCRLYHMGRAIKGVLLMNKKLPPRTIQVRPSMIKVNTDPSLPMESINSLEIVTTSNKPKRTSLSANLILLLSYGGVPDEFFMDLLRCGLTDADHVFTNKRAALRVSIIRGDMDDFLAARMILSGIPLDEPCLQNQLSIFAKEELKNLRAGRLHVPNSYYLMGTVDPTGCLKRDQVCIIHENGQISGDVLVYRNPGLHFGDIHVLQATYVKELESFVGQSRYAIFFPSVGPRSVADEIAGGDYDGDTYWVSQNAQLLKYFRKSDPWIESPPAFKDDYVIEPGSLAADRLEDELFKLYLETRFQQSATMGIAADSWKALMDRLLTLRDDCPKMKEVKKRVKENILKLIDIYYVALDAPKKGGKKLEVPKELKPEMYPHYMEKDSSFTSTSILGLIYDEVCNYQSQDISRKDIVKLPCFDVDIPQNCLNMWKLYYGEYRREMSSALNGDPTDKDKAAEEVTKKYREKLYGACELENSPKCLEDIYNEALAVYHVTYDYAKSENSAGRCGFAWKVAGSALLKFYASKQGQRTFTCVPSVLREIFG